MAAQLGHLEMVRAMLDAGADRLGLSRTHAVLADLGAWSRG